MDDQQVDSDVLHARVVALVQAVKDSGVPLSELHTGLALLGLGMHQLFAAGVTPEKVARTITLLRADPRLADALVMGIGLGIGL